MKVHCYFSTILLITLYFGFNSSFNPDRLNNNARRIKREWLVGISCPPYVQMFKGREDIKFTLYNKNVSDRGIDISKDIRAGGKLLPNTPIKIIIHGFLNNGTSPMPSLITKAYMKRPENHNVIVVDWSRGSGEGVLDYYLCHIPSRIVPLVVQGVTDFIMDLIKFQNINILYVNLIGHSLGAQISARVGKKLINAGNKLPAIVALDPARPDFRNLPENERLCANDAEYVEVIHTNNQNLGTFRPLGTADFYPNYNINSIGEQPGCLSDATCSHARSYQYFAESVANPYAFEAVKCESFDDLKNNNCGKTGKSTNVKVFMGGPDLRQAKLPGIFYLTTNSQPPYGLFS